jgi:hypothetical protein
MDNEIVIVGGKYDDGTKMILKILFKKSFSWTMLNNSRNIVMKWVSHSRPPLPKLLLTTLYIYFMEN